MRSGVYAITRLIIYRHFESKETLSCAVRLAYADCPA
jgi:hypothetical protein